MQGRKTHEQQLRILERKDDVPKAREVAPDAVDERTRDRAGPLPAHPEARQSEFPVSRGGMNQESHQNKPDRPGPADRGTGG